MTGSASADAVRMSWVRTLLVGLVACVTLTDAALLVGVPTTEQVDSLRLLLAAGAFGVPVLGFVLGIVQRPLYAVGAVLSVPLVVLYAYTGLLLPWTQLSFTLGQFGLDLLLGVPVVGDPLATVLFGGPTLSEATLRASFRYHYALVALGIAGVLAVLVRSGWRRLSSSSRITAAP